MRTSSVTFLMVIRFAGRADVEDAYASHEVIERMRCDHLYGCDLEGGWRCSCLLGLCVNRREGGEDNEHWDDYCNLPEAHHGFQNSASFAPCRVAVMLILQSVLAD